MKPTVAVIMGGKSAEREISLKTGSQICSALKTKSYGVMTFDLDGELYDNLRRARPDVVYIALHGKYGEDGCLQGMLEIMGIPYVGSGVLASALAMNKAMSKRLFMHWGIPTPAGVCICKPDWAGGGWQGPGHEFLSSHGYPIIVKPNRQGSTIGLRISQSPDVLEQDMAFAFEYDDEILLEEYIKGPELTVGIIGNRNPEALPVIEIVSETGLYDYKAKYTKGLSHHIIPARVSESALATTTETAIKAHKALGCRGISRVDLILSQSGIPYVLEVNTLPGMTETSLVPDAARAIGIEFPDLVERLILFALEP